MRTVEVKVHHGSHCYAELKVTRNNSTPFLTPRTHILKKIGTIYDGALRGNQQQPTTSWRARTASAHGAEATVATIHSHTSIARASAPEECVRDSAAEGGGHTHTH